MALRVIYRDHRSSIPQGLTLRGVARMTDHGMTANVIAWDCRKYLHRNRYCTVCLRLPELVSLQQQRVVVGEVSFGIWSHILVSRVIGGEYCLE